MPVQYSGDSAQLRFAWDRTALYLFVQVTDDAFVQQYAGRQLWDGDALQIGLCLEPFKQFKATADAFADSFNRPAQTEINVALTPEGPMVFRELQFPESDHFKPGVLTPDKAPLAITRDAEGKLNYEMALPWQTLGLTKAPSPGEHIAVTVAVNDRDIEDGKKQWQPSALSLYEGATGEKDRELMGLLCLGE
jgi:hypothetical protein